VVLLLVAFAVLVACSDDENSRADIPADCGLPSPSPGLDEALIPVELVPPDAEISSAARRKGGITGVINLPLGVQPAFDFYREAVKRAGFKIIQLDNEGFEAELYLRRARTLGAIQVRRSVCNDASVAFVNLIKARVEK
jgi:hypothetical protein